MNHKSAIVRKRKRCTKNMNHSKLPITNNEKHFLNLFIYFGMTFKVIKTILLNENVIKVSQ